MRRLRYCSWSQTVNPSAVLPLVGFALSVNPALDWRRVASIHRVEFDSQPVIVVVAMRHWIFGGLGCIWCSFFRSVVVAGAAQVDVLFGQ
jgi:hypothetical protein